MRKLINLFIRLLAIFSKNKHQAQIGDTNVTEVTTPDSVEQPIETKEPKKEDSIMTSKPIGQISKNFHLTELTRSQTADRLGIDNTPEGVHLDNIVSLVENFLQPLREKLGKPIVVSSGYRSPALNAAIGGVNTSQHSLGHAVDFECIGVDNKWLASFIKANMDFDQLILEFYNPDEGPNSGWVHASYVSSKENRKQVISAVKIDGKTVYLPGLVDNTDT